MSSFRRIVPTTAQPHAKPVSTLSAESVPHAIAGATPPAPTLFPGTKRWIDGSLLVSSGHSGFDALLGGGLSLGGLVCFDADSSFVHADAFASLFLAQGAASGHNMIVGSYDRDDMTRFLNQLPLNVSRGSQDTAAVASREKTTEPASDDNNSSDSIPKPSLTIAHSYAKYMGVASIPKEDGKYCNTFDLNRHIPAETLAAASISHLDLQPLPPPEDIPLAPDRVNRVYLHHVGHAFDPFALEGSALHLLGGGYTTTTARALSGAFGLDGCDPEFGLESHTASSRHLQLKLFMLGIKRLLQQNSDTTTVLVSMRLSQLPPGVAAELKSVFDVVIKLHSFSDPSADIGLHSRFSGETSLEAAGTAPEFADCQGLLLLRKTMRPGRGLVARQDTQLFTLKRDKRKITIEKPHLPPEDAKETGGNTMSCNSAPSSGATLDF